MNFDEQCFLFTVDFSNLYTNIPVQDAIYCLQELIWEYKNVIPNAEFIVALLDIALKNSPMTFEGENIKKYLKLYNIGN